MAGGCSGGGEGCSSSLSRVVRASSAYEAVVSKSGCLSQIIDRLAGGVSSAPSCA